MNDYYSPVPCHGNYFHQSNGMPQQQYLSNGSARVGFNPLPTYPFPSIGTTLPTGVPLGPTTSGSVPTAPAVPAVPTVPGGQLQPPGEIPPLTTVGTMYTAGFLKTQIGKKVRVEFLIGTTSMTDRIGTLLGVGASYILIRPEETDDTMLCDLYSIKFVTIYH